MIEKIGTTFPASWQYGPDEIEIFDSTVRQIDQHFPDSRNLVINTTWFGSQFDNSGWRRILDLQAKFDNLFLLAVIDPIYLLDTDLQFIIDKFSIKQVHRIGMFADSVYEWNFHSVSVRRHCPQYSVQDLTLTDPQYVYMLYQRKPRLHRVEITNLILERNLDKKGILTLGDNNGSNYDWTQGRGIPSLITIDDSPQNYKHNGSKTDFGGIPNDLVSLGRLDLWQKHFLNIISETEFDNWTPRFITEKTWKPIIGLRPFIIHGQTSIYHWLRDMGFQTFNDYWSHIPIESSDDQHGTVLSVIDWLGSKSKEQLLEMYNDMLPRLIYNSERYQEFSKEQEYKMHNLFQGKIR
jgi:hypothetical protein